MNIQDISPTRRRLLQSAGLLTLSGKCSISHAQTAWPEKPVRIIVPSAAGGAPDVICRLILSEVQKNLSKAFVIENKPGAGGNIGMSEIVRAPADGYHFGYGNIVTLAINPSLYKTLPFDRDKQLVPVALLGFVQNALVVRPDLPVKTAQELIAYAKSRPGQLTMGSAGNGTTGHLGGELFKTMTGSFIVHVPYRGSPQAIQDLIGGRIDMMFDNLASIGPHIRAGRVKALAVSGAKRATAFAELPTLSEAAVPGYNVIAWGGIVAPIGTPTSIIRQFNMELNKVSSSTQMAERFASLSWEPATGPAEQLFELARREQPIWQNVVKRSGATID